MQHEQPVWLEAHRGADHAGCFGNTQGVTKREVRLGVDDFRKGFTDGIDVCATETIIALGCDFDDLRPRRFGRVRQGFYFAG